VTKTAAPWWRGGCRGFSLCELFLERKKRKSEIGVGEREKRDAVQA
jgi:hypothetical protein